LKNHFPHVRLTWDFDVSDKSMIWNACKVGAFNFDGFSNNLTKYIGLLYCRIAMLVVLSGGKQFEWEATCNDTDSFGIAGAWCVSGPLDHWFAR